VAHYCHWTGLDDQMATKSLAQETGNTDQLKKCDNNLLIIKKDVCPSHNNAFPVCTEPKLDTYISERRLDSAKTPMEWMVEPSK
jgi:hypothetical protein